MAGARSKSRETVVRPCAGSLGRVIKAIGLGLGALGLDLRPGASQSCSGRRASRGDRGGREMVGARSKS